MLYSLNLYNVIHQLFLNKIRKKEDNSVQMAVLPKLIYRFNIILIKIPVAFSFFFFLRFNFINFWLHWVFIVAHRISLFAAGILFVTVRGGSSHCSGFSCCGARPLGMWASVVLARRLSSCGAQA